MSETCSRCDLPASHRQGRQNLCPMHYRFGQMRAGAKRNGKAVPSMDILAGLVGPNLACADCGVQMNWLARDDQTRVATLQHYRDGAFGLVCRSCNTRHAFTPGDDYRSLPKDHKWCPKCLRAKPDNEFAADRGRSGPRKLKSSCRSCAANQHADWTSRNKDHVNAKQRENRAIRKARRVAC